MEDKTINIKIDEIKKDLASLQISEDNLDDSLKTKINSIDVSGKVDKAQGILNANKNVVTDNSGNITTEAKPTLPTVNNGVLTIQKNGTNVATFNANSSSNVTANISVPTSASDFSDVVPTTRKVNGKALSSDITLTSSDVGALSSSTLYATDLEVSGNKFYLKDQNSAKIGGEIDIVQGVTLNGTLTKTPSFYAPTSAGTSGQVLQSNGSGAPTWQNISGGTEVVNNLISNSTTSALSAYQGRVLDTCKAEVTASNLTNAYVANWQTKLNDLSTPSLTDGSPHTNYGQAVVIESYLSSDKKTWYRVWSDGWKECGFTFSNGGTIRIDYTLNLPITFSNINYGIERTNASTASQNSSFRSISISSITTSSFKATFSDAQYACKFYCCGY